MPRYFFQVTNGEQVLDPPNPDGVDLPGDAAARDQAAIIARDLKHAEDGPGDLPGDSWDGWFVRIVDENAQEIDSVSIADAPELS